MTNPGFPPQHDRDPALSALPPVSGPAPVGGGLAYGEQFRPGYEPQNPSNGTGLATGALVLACVAIVLGWIQMATGRSLAGTHSFTTYEIVMTVFNGVRGCLDLAAIILASITLRGRGKGPIIGAIALGAAATGMLGLVSVYVSMLYDMLPS